MRDIDAISGLTDRPFAVNHVPQSLDEKTFAATLHLLYEGALVASTAGADGRAIADARRAAALLV